MENEKKKSTFGMREREDLLIKFENKYVIIVPRAVQSTYSGKLIGRFLEYMILNPHTSREQTEKGFILKLVEKEELIRESDIFSIEETTEENLGAYCEWLNKKEGVTQTSQ